MSTTDHQIGWHVTGVFDPDSGVVFAYTVGLVDHGVPELHIWNQPTDGADPGAGWRLSMRDMHGTLNHVGAALVDGERAIGDQWSTTMDNGLTTIRWHLAEPVGRDEVDAFGVADGAPVAPLRWELERSSITAPPARLQARMFSEVAIRLAHLPGRGCVAPDTAVLGPAAAAVAEARRVALGLDPMSLFRNSLGSDGEERWFSGTLGTLLVAASRELWVDAVGRAAHEDALVLARTFDDPDARFMSGLTSLFESVLRACYLAVAATDIMSSLEPTNGITWEALATNILGVIADPVEAELALGERGSEAYLVVDRAGALAGVGADAQRPAWSLVWWAITRHGARLDESRWMDLAEAAGCTDEDVLGAAVAIVSAWAVAELAGVPTRLADEVVPFLEAIRALPK
jgi:hypothetical protein